MTRLHFIRQARKLGFEVPAVCELLVFVEQPDRACREVDGIARRLVEAIDRRIDQLLALRRGLQQALDTCGHGRVGDCHVVGALTDVGPGEEALSSTVPA